MSYKVKFTEYQYQVTSTPYQVLDDWELMIYRSRVGLTLGMRGALGFTVVQLISKDTPPFWGDKLIGSIMWNSTEATLYAP